MSELSDLELNAVRIRILDLIKSFFIGEPTEEKVNVWKDVIQTLSHEDINPTLDAAVRKLEEMLTSLKLEELKDEHYDLFTNPFSETIVQNTLSYYADGHDFGQSLVDLRRFLLNTGIVKKNGIDQCEDSLVFLLDVLSTLINDEQTDPETAQKNQREFLYRFLDPFSVYYSTALAKNKRADFYGACAAFLAGYVELEKGLMVNI